MSNPVYLINLLENCLLLQLNINYSTNLPKKKNQPSLPPSLSVSLASFSVFLSVSTLPPCSGAWDFHHYWPSYTKNVCVHLCMIYSLVQLIEIWTIVLGNSILREGNVNRSEWLANITVPLDFLFLFSLQFWAFWGPVSLNQSRRECFGLCVLKLASELLTSYK